MTTATVEMRGQLNPGSRRNYALAGNATITVRSPRGNRFTFKIVESKNSGDTKPTVYFVKVLVGADNTSNYTYLGTIFSNGEFRVTAKSRIQADAPSAQAFTWLVKNWENDKVEVWHEGSCGRCGRKLTVPESIELGIGPTCAGAGGAVVATQRSNVSDALAKKIVATAERAFGAATVKEKPLAKPSVKATPPASEISWTAVEGGYVTELSNIGTGQDVSSPFGGQTTLPAEPVFACPACRNYIALSAMSVRKDGEGEVTEWFLSHQCGMDVTVFND